MKKFCFVVGMAFSLAAHAGFDEGKTAFNAADFGAAMQQWLPLANQGDARAQLSLGLMYANGRGVPQDYKEALVWLRKAAAQAELDFLISLLPPGESP